MSATLAIHGGEPAIPPGTIQPGPPIMEPDETRVLQALRSGVHAWGANCEALQKEWSAWNGNRHTIALTSGTAALQMCLAACGVQAGDEVITPAYSWTSSVSCILHHGCIPVFVDVDPIWSNIDPSKLEAAITPRTKAILVVHLHGVPADLDAIGLIADRHHIPVIEDCCQAHGTLHRGRKVGTIGPCGAFSLNQNKMLSAGEGGLFVTDSEDMCERGRSLVLFGDFRKPEVREGYPGHGLGYMYRYNELNAALARSQLTRLDEYIAHSRNLFAFLRHELAGIAGLILPSEPEFGTENGYNFVLHVAPDAVDFDGPVNFLREAVVQALQAEGAPASVWQRRILPEYTAVAARNAYGRGVPWPRDFPPYHPGDYPSALYHSASYFIIGGLRLPNGQDVAGKIAHGVRKVFDNLGQLDIKGLASAADVSLYERGWKPRRAPG